MCNGEELKKQYGDNSQSEWQAWEMGLYPGGDGKPLKVSEQSRDLHTLRPWQRKERRSSPSRGEADTGLTRSAGRSTDRKGLRSPKSTVSRLCSTNNKKMWGKSVTSYKVFLLYN